MNCEELKRAIERHGFEIRGISEDTEKCVIDFKHPKIEVKPPVAYFASAVQFNKKRNVLTTTVRSKVDGFKELYLDYCCENNEQMCRPHFHTDFKTISVEATFFENPIKKFDRLLEELK